MTLDSTLIPPNLRHRLQQCYQHGTKLMEQESYDFDYAHTLFQECVNRDPANILYLEAFLDNLHRKFNNNKRGSLLNFGGRGALRKALAKQDWHEVLRLGSGILKSNPWDIATLRSMAQACESLDYNEPELRYLKNALEANPKDVDVSRHCASSLSRMGQFDQAIACWNRVDELCRGDREAQEQISQLQVEKTKTRREGGKRKGVTRQAPSDPVTEAPPSNDSDAAASSRRKIPLTPRQRLEQEIVNSPTDLPSYLQLAELHVDAGRLSEALRILQKALAASGGDFKVLEQLEDTEILRKDQQIAVADKRAAAERNEETRDLAARLRSDMDRYELDIYDRRSQRYPQDLELKFQLGLRLKRVGNFGEAIKTFEHSVQLPQRQAGSNLEIGECLQRRKKYSKALEYYLRAADQAQANQQIDVRKLGMYRASLLAAGLGNPQSAEKTLCELLELDADYKDVQARLDKLRQMRHKE